ncbi:formyltetrahydrofolate deformylase [Hydrogenibacillus schlegelii]|uniref:formyltetrahydrofolate deformylase n=1 Tax=Hydrogenibacillus schlegelii TaxID=1484 RepID=UPI0007922CFD|nr:formyltetrahydrofolate deformylase [Hydrogenibacillus schlegelii]KWX06672.1 formyltetrahydrofolate deformylase [Hydrogenibacillus schlegelii]
MSQKLRPEILQNRARILLSCPDRPGIVAETASFLYRQGANIVALDQYTTDPAGGLLFIRVEFDLPDLPAQKKALEAGFAEVARRLDMQWEIRYAADRKRIAVFVSTADHALLELLYQWKTGELAGDIVLVISNHETLRPAVEPFGLPYFYIPVTPETKPEAEARQIALLTEYRVDLLVLARYMQILSPEFVRRYPNRIINIHHSFLPAFVGARPYERAYARGVKLIGATAHYVTEELDEGPIIEQDVERVTHRADVATLKKIGRNIERIVLARAVQWHLEDRILTYQNKTIVFY